MRAKQLLIGLFGAGAVLSTGTACAHNSGEAAGDVAPANAIGILVKNNNFLDVDVYAVADGVPTRLGTVTGNSKRSFAIDPSFATQNFGIVATPIGGSGRASTGNVLVSAGQTVEFTVGSTLANSSVVVRQ
jgi:hypothetical protein